MIGYYVHHHGAGHLARALGIIGPDTQRFTLLGTGLGGRTGDVSAIDLPDDRLAGDIGFEGEDGERVRPTALHYAPVHHEGVRRRTAIMANWLAQRRPALMVIDVSVEAAMLARLAATPTVVVRLGGDRTDPAHLDAFRGATRLLAPFHPDLEDPSTPDWIRTRTLYAPDLGSTVRSSSGPIDDRTVLVVFGAGGGAANGDALADAARANPDLIWRVVGPVSGVDDPPPNLILLGWLDDIGPEVRRAGVVIGSAGTGVVGEVLGADKPFVCLPQARPFDEQIATARGLARAGAAVCLEAWPIATAWSSILDAARGTSPHSRARLLEGAGAADVRRWLYDLADRVTCQDGELR